MATIRKRGNVYQIRVSCGYNVKGKQITRTMSWKPEADMTKNRIEKEVSRQAVLFEEKCFKGQTASAVKFENFAEQWYEEYAKGNMKKGSLDTVSRVKKRVYSAIGHLRMDKITVRHIQNFINKLHDEPNKRTGKPYARNSIIKHLHFISRVFTYAVKMDMLSDNPCRKVNVSQKEKSEKSIYTIEETRQLMELLKEKAPFKYYVFFVILVYSGLRRGEMLGLEWKDIDYSNCILSVSRTSNYTPADGLYTDTTKTRRSNRRLKLPEYVMDLLKRYQEEQNIQKNRLGDVWKETDRIFTRWNGGPLHTHTPRAWLKKFCKQNDFKYCDVHSFRHLNASLLINAGIDIASVSAALGHAQVTTTLNVYSHQFLERQLKCGEAISEALKFKL
jgi:integrase